LGLFQTKLKPLRDIMQPKGGILEPALALFLFRSEKAAARMLKLDSQWCDPDVTATDDDDVDADRYACLYYDAIVMFCNCSVMLLRADVVCLV